jgi:hypothetical protein
MTLVSWRYARQHHESPDSPICDDSHGIYFVSVLSDISRPSRRLHCRHPQGKILGTGAVSGLSGPKGQNLFKTKVWLDNYQLQADGAAIAFNDRLEQAYARQSFSIKNSDVEIQQGRFPVRYRVLGNLLYDTSPQVPLGVEYGELSNDSVVSSVGAHHDSGTPITAQNQLSAQLAALKEEIAGI